MFLYADYLLYIGTSLYSKFVLPSHAGNSIVNCQVILIKLMFYGISLQVLKLCSLGLPRRFPHRTQGGENHPSRRDEKPEFTMDEFSYLN